MVSIKEYKRKSNDNKIKVICKIKEKKFHVISKILAFSKNFQTTKIDCKM